PHQIFLPTPISGYPVQKLSRFPTNNGKNDSARKLFMCFVKQVLSDRTRENTGTPKMSAPTPARPAVKSSSNPKQNSMPVAGGLRFTLQRTTTKSPTSKTRQWV